MKCIYSEYRSIVVGPYQIILKFHGLLQSVRWQGKTGKKKKKNEHHLKSMNLIKSHTKSGLANTIKKEKNLIVSMTDVNRNERVRYKMGESKI